MARFPGGFYDTEPETSIWGALILFDVSRSSYQPGGSHV